MTPLAIIRSHEGYFGLQSALRARWKALGISGEDMDEGGELAAAYASKLLSPHPPKHLGGKSLGAIMNCLGIMLVVVEDQELMGKIVRRTVPRKNASAAMLPRKLRKKRSIWKGSTAWALTMNCRRTLVLAPAKRKAIARKAARARWRSKQAKN